MVNSLCLFLLLSALQAEMDSFQSRKVFILVSTVMTWALTKPRGSVRLLENVVDLVLA